MKITICGSIGFYKEMEAARDRLVEFGHEVKIPELALEVPQEFGEGKKVNFGKFIEENGGIDAFPAGHAIWNLKEGAIRDHRDRGRFFPEEADLYPETGLFHVIV